jgi:hypothetical protein
MCPLFVYEDISVASKVNAQGGSAVQFTAFSDRENDSWCVRTDKVSSDCDVDRYVGVGSFSETSVNYQTTPRYITEHGHCCENLKCNIPDSEEFRVLR